jgi:uncharacterized linocin/CFP29 family protein
MSRCVLIQRRRYDAHAKKGVESVPDEVYERIDCGYRLLAISSPFKVVHAAASTGRARRVTPPEVRSLPFGPR